MILTLFEMQKLDCGCYSPVRRDEVVAEVQHKDENQIVGVDVVSSLWVITLE